MAKWIQSAVKHPGRVKAIAKREGGLLPDGTIKQAWLKMKLARTKDKSLKRALILARRFKKGI